MAASPSTPFTPSRISEQYPIGPPDRHPQAAALPAHIAAIRALPAAFTAAFAGLGQEQLATPYRAGGWTLRRLAHHLADSHSHAYLRIKTALAAAPGAPWPTIQPYDEKRWAETPDASGPIEDALALLPPLHNRIAALLEDPDAALSQRGYLHPENGPTSLLEVAALYSWHGRHHLAHAQNLRIRKGW